MAAASTASELAGGKAVSYPCRMTEARHEHDEAQRRAALASLDRLRHEGDGLLTSALAQEARRAAEPEANASDPAEVWGRRIGRALSVAVFAALLLYFAAAYLQ
jgi:cytochrome c-type biogenesis protein CcmH/NrfG